MAGVTNQNNRHNAFFSPFSVDDPNRVVVTNAQGYAIASEVTYQQLLSIVEGGGEGSLMGANNGLSLDGSIVQLGGVLITPTVIDFGSTTLSFLNVPTGATSDELLTMDGSGVIRKIDGSSYVEPSELSEYALDANVVHKTRVLNINGNDLDLSLDREWRVAQGDTGCLTSVGLTANSGTTINVGAVEGYVVDNETDPANPVYTKITYAGETNKTVTTIGSGLSTYVMLGVGGVISFQNTFPTSAERKAKIWLGKVGHPSGTITTVINEPDFITSPQAFSRDLFQALGPYINSNVYPYANGANLSVNITAGSIRGNGINFVGSVANRQDPDKLNVGPFTPVTFLYRTRTGVGGAGVTLIDPTNYDLAGTITAIGGGVNRSTIQYMFCIPGVGFVFQYGQYIYNTLTDAISAIGRESFTVFSNLPDNAILIGVLAVKRTATNLSDETQAHFFNADKLGQIIGATSGVSVGTMQTGYNNSLAPQITTSTTLGAIQYKRGSVADTDNVLQILNGAGTATFSVTGDGLTTEKGFVTNGSFSAVANLAKANHINNTIVATANNDELIGLDINPAFTLGAFTGVNSRALKVTGIFHIAGNIQNNTDNTYLLGGSTANWSRTRTRVVEATTGGFLDFAYGGATQGRLVGATGNWILQNGGTFTDDATNRLQVNGSGIFKGGAEALKVSTATGNPDHAYLGFYARTASPTTRSGYVGYNGVATSNLTIANSISGGHINLVPTGAGNVGVGTAAPDSKFQVGTGSDGAGLRIRYSVAQENYYDGSIHYFRGQDNVTNYAAIDNTGMTLNGALGLFSASEPSTNASYGKIWAQNISGTVEMRVKDGAGNVTTISPHNHTMIPDGEIVDDMGWYYYSERDGKRINVNMYKAIHDLQELTGNRYIYQD